ncbi:MAG: hypothetical protein JFR38_03225 [Muribaculaceae bacterium]|nr:hypothetical protein [Muribaculaceae bacterium]
MMQRVTKAQLKLMKYGAFIGIIGGIASFVGPPHNGLIKAMIGVVIGCMLLGKRLPIALKEMYDANKPIMDEIEDSFKD